VGAGSTGLFANSGYFNFKKGDLFQCYALIGSGGSVLTLSWVSMRVKNSNNKSKWINFSS
jgi:hypothetical protein